MRGGERMVKDCGEPLDCCLISNSRKKGGNRRKKGHATPRDKVERTANWEEIKEF